MPDQFVVPQFLDVESKIIGPITGRQFIILMFMLLGDFVIYRVFLSLVALIGLALPFSAICLSFAFVRVNGKPLHYLVLNMVQTLRRPGLRVWDKDLNDAEVKARMAKPPEALPPPPPMKRRMEGSRLSELTLVVNTGGVYSPDDEGVTGGFMQEPIAKVESKEKKPYGKK